MQLLCVVLVLVTRGAAALFHALSMAALAPPKALPPDSFFGYSIAYERHSKRLVSSAPRADNVGHVYSCDVAARNCFKLDVMSPSDISLRPPNYSDHYFWLGATVKADASNLMVCAPRHTSKMRMTNGHMHFATYGSCYSKNFLSNSTDGKFELLKKIKLEERQRNAALNEHLTDSFGWSIDFAADSRVRVGGPAMCPGRVMTYDPKNPAVAPSLLDGNASKSKVNYNFGYSIASGHYFSTVVLNIAIGTPYGEMGKGKVIFFENNKYVGAIVDEEIGSMFGAALCSARLTKSRASLIIGAPAYFRSDGDKDRYHTGMVHVYVPKKQKLKLAAKIEGPKDGGFFGYSIGNVGDMDRDGIDEIVIAAPYEDGGAGAVYVYSGASLALAHAPRWLQRIQPEGFRSFGLSLTAFTYSDNGCNDLAIGAPGNDRVAVYHCLAVIDVTVEAEFPDIQRRTDKNSFEFSACLNASDMPEKPKIIKASFEVTVKITHPSATLSGNAGDSVKIPYTVLREDPRPCRKIKVMTAKDGDYESSIRLDIKAELVDDPSLKKHFDPSKATLGTRSSLSGVYYVNAADCHNGVCAPKLSLDVNSSLSETYVTGSTELEWLHVSVRNGAGDAAYLPCARARLTGGGAGAGFTLAPPACPWTGHTHKRLCKLQGALLSDSTWNITDAGALVLDMRTLTSDSSDLRLSVDVFSRCSEDAPAVTWARGVRLLHDNRGIRLHGKTDQGEQVNVTKVDIQTGKRIQHTYTIINTQGTNWKSLVCEIWLKKEPYVEFNFPIQIYREDSEPVPACRPGAQSESNIGYTLKCPIGDLFRKDTVTIIIPIYIPPGKLVNIYETLNATIQSSITLQFNKKATDIKNEVTTTLTLQQAVVPIWIYVVAGAVGVMLVFLIAFAMYECGCLRRKNKELLENLRTEVKRKSKILHRQSMRLSDDARQSLRNRTYRELLDEAEAKEAEGGCIGSQLDPLEPLDDHDQLESSLQLEPDQATPTMVDRKKLIEESLKKQKMKRQ